MLPSIQIFQIHWLPAPCGLLPQGRCRGGSLDTTRRKTLLRPQAVNRHVEMPRNTSRCGHILLPVSCGSGWIFVIAVGSDEYLSIGYGWRYELGEQTHAVLAEGSIQRLATPDVLADVCRIEGEKLSPDASLLVGIPKERYERPYDTRARLVTVRGNRQHPAGHAVRYQVETLRWRCHQLAILI